MWIRRKVLLFILVIGLCVFQGWRVAQEYIPGSYNWGQNLPTSASADGDGYTHQDTDFEAMAIL